MGIKSAKNLEAEHSIVKTVNEKKTLYVSPGHLIKINNVNETDIELKQLTIKFNKYLDNSKILLNKIKNKNIHSLFKNKNIFQNKNLIKKIF